MATPPAGSSAKPARGVSANLCDALTGLHTLTKSKALSISVGWAAVRPSGSLPKTPVNIPRDAVPVLREASRMFKQRHPDAEAELVGYVTLLRRDEGALFGNVSVIDEGSAPPRRVRVADLPVALYDRVLDAHRAEQKIRVIGNLRKEGRWWVLRGARDLEVLADDGDDA